MGQNLVAHVAVVDKSIKIARVGKRSGCRAQIAVNRDFSSSKAKWHQLLGNLASQHLMQTILTVAHGHVVGNRAAVMLQAEMNARMRQCHAVDGVANMAQLGGRRLEKLFSCRRVEKNLLDLDGCADGNCRRSNLVLLSAIDPQAISHWRARYTRQNLHLGYRTDARQRLAAKSQGGDAKQIVIVLELARRMTLNCKIQVLCSHSFAVVGDANQRCAASFNPNKNLRCAGVERVL